MEDNFHKIHMICFLGLHIVLLFFNVYNNQYKVYTDMIENLINKT